MKKYPYKTGYKLRGREKVVYSSFSKAAVNLRYRVLALKYKTAFLFQDIPIGEVLTRLFSRPKIEKQLMEQILEKNVLIEKLKSTTKNIEGGYTLNYPLIFKNSEEDI